MSARSRMPRLVAVDRHNGVSKTPAGLALDALPPAPSYFGPVAKRAYEVIIGDLADMRSLAPGDTLLIIPAARALERWFHLDQMIVSGKATELTTAEGGSSYMSGEAQARAAALNEFRRCCMDLGIGPRGRRYIEGTAQTDFMALLGPVARPAPSPDRSDADEDDARDAIASDDAGLRLDPFKALSGYGKTH